MLKIARKRRPPLIQLRKAANIAKSMLFARGLVSGKSIFEKLAEDPDAPILPGRPPYLPEPWTIEAARQILMILVKDWVKANNGDSEKQEKIQPFFRFIISRLDEKERRWRIEARKDRAFKSSGLEPIASIFANLDRAQITRAMKTLLVESFAISVIVKANDTVSDYLTWFIEDWTPKLNDLWKNKKKA